jgi:hypothetical protein
MVARRQGQKVLPLRSVFSGLARSSERSAPMIDCADRRVYVRGPPRRVAIPRLRKRVITRDDTGRACGPAQIETKNQPSS